MTKPRSESFIVFAVLGLALTGAVLGYGFGHQGAPKLDEPASSSAPLALPASTVVHPPMICRGGVCAELKAGALRAG